MESNLCTDNEHLSVRNKGMEGADYPVAVCVLCSALSVMSSSIPVGWWGAPQTEHGNCSFVCGSWCVLLVPL